MAGYIIAFDIGGTTVKAGVVDTHLFLLDETLGTYPSKSDQDADAIVDNLDSIILDQWGKIRHDNSYVQGIGFGFPGPFDYEKGISYIRGLGKYDSIYGLNIGDAMMKRVLTSNITLADDFRIVFENDAAVFTLGEYEHLKGMGYNRLMGITLGTGCGSSFIDQGQIVRGRDGVPISGEIFNQPFKESIIDDYISRRGILRLAGKQGMNAALMDVADLAALAKRGDRQCLSVFDEFGHMLGEALKPFIRQFSPDVIVFGGRISKGFDLIRPSFIETLQPAVPKIRVSEDLSRSALIGVANVVMKK